MFRAAALGRHRGLVPVRPLFRRSTLAATGVTIAMLAFVGVAAAETVTVGADFGSPGYAGPLAGACAGSEGEPGASCGYVTVTAPGPSSGAVATADGTVKAWRLDGASATPGYSVNVVRPEGESPTSPWTVTASSEPVTPVGTGGAQTFATDLPIQAGEYVELTVPNGGAFDAFGIADPENFQSELAAMMIFVPGLTSGESRVPGPTGMGLPWPGIPLPFHYAYNADIEYPSLDPPDDPHPPTTIETPPATTVQTSSAATPEAIPTPTRASLPAPCVVPRLTGKKLKMAKRLLKKAGCGIGKVARKNAVTASGGKIIGQAPKPGKKLAPRSKVKVTLGRDAPLR